jgi:hypothetical protein
MRRDRGEGWATHLSTRQRDEHWSPVRLPTCLAILAHCPMWLCMPCCSSLSSAGVQLPREMSGHRLLFHRFRHCCGHTHTHPRGVNKSENVGLWWERQARCLARWDAPPCHGCYLRLWNCDRQSAAQCSPSPSGQTWSRSCRGCRDGLRPRCDEDDSGWSVGGLGSERASFRCSGNDLLCISLVRSASSLCVQLRFLGAVSLVAVGMDSRMPVERTMVSCACWVGSTQKHKRRDDVVGLVEVYKEL